MRFQLETLEDNAEQPTLIGASVDEDGDVEIRINKVPVCYITQDGVLLRYYLTDELQARMAGMQFDNFNIKVV